MIEQEEWCKQINGFDDIIMEALKNDQIQKDTVFICGAITLLARTLMRFEVDPQQMFEMDAEQVLCLQQKIPTEIKLPFNRMTCAKCGTDVFIQMELANMKDAIICPACDFSDWEKAN